VVGSIAHAVPATELPAVLRALDGEIVVRGELGERHVPGSQLFQGPLTTAVAPGEMITEVRAPARSPADGAVVEISRRVADFAIAGAAVSLWTDGDQPAAIALTVNGVRREAEVESRLLLVDFLRQQLDGVSGRHPPANARSTWVRRTEPPSRLRRWTGDHHEPRPVRGDRPGASADSHRRS
jgi:xanthine dehydrogenase iron-sulfur cluster and FAD-binding subunit A